MLWKIFISITLLIFYSCHIQGESGECRDGTTRNLTPHQMLRQDLFCSYDKESRPVKDFHKSITINFRLFVILFTLDEFKNILDVHAWLEMTWTDEGLKWNPEDYSNVNILHVKSYDIWQPDLSIYNSGNLETNGFWEFTHCEINSTGEVYCIPSIKWSAQCTVNLQPWPFDQHNCYMTIGSWLHEGEQMNISLNAGGVSLADFTSNHEWELLNVTAFKKISTYQCCPNETYQTIDFRFHIKRHADSYAVTVVFPSLAINLLSLSSYWLDRKKTSRLAVCYISTLCHCLYLQYLGLKLPTNGTKTPVIILLYRDSLIITCVALIMAIAFERQSSSSNDSSATPVPMPAWLNKFVGVVLNQKAGRLLLLGKFDSKRGDGDGVTLEQNGSQSNEARENHEWVMFIAIIDHLGFSISLIVYFILYLALIPEY